MSGSDDIEFYNLSNSGFRQDDEENPDDDEMVDCVVGEVSEEDSSSSNKKNTVSATIDERKRLEARENKKKNTALSDSALDSEDDENSDPEDASHLMKLPAMEKIEQPKAQIPTKKPSSSKNNPPTSESPKKQKITTTNLTSSSSKNSKEKEKLPKKEGEGRVLYPSLPSMLDSAKDDYFSKPSTSPTPIILTQNTKSKSSSPQVTSKPKMKSPQKASKKNMEDDDIMSEELSDEEESDEEDSQEEKEEKNKGKKKQEKEQEPPKKPTSADIANKSLPPQSKNKKEAAKVAPSNKKSKKQKFEEDSGVSEEEKDRQEEEERREEEDRSEDSESEEEKPQQKSKGKEIVKNKENSSDDEQKERNDENGDPFGSSSEDEGFIDEDVPSKQVQQPIIKFSNPGSPAISQQNQNVDLDFILPTKQVNSVILLERSYPKPYINKSVQVSNKEEKRKALLAKKQKEFTASENMNENYHEVVKYLKRVSNWQKSVSKDDSTVNCHLLIHCAGEDGENGEDGVDGEPIGNAEEEPKPEKKKKHKQVSAPPATGQPHPGNNGIDGKPGTDANSANSGDNGNDATSSYFKLSLQKDLNINISGSIDATIPLNIDDDGCGIFIDAHGGRGGNGGNGGNGGKGGDGTDGGRGEDGKDLLNIWENPSAIGAPNMKSSISSAMTANLINGAPGGNGGNGGKGGKAGDGGEGGDGGSGGNILIEVDNPALLMFVEVNVLGGDSGKGGKSGTPGQGGGAGSGGAGGKPGKSETSSLGKPGPAGKPGLPGTTGDSGKDGKKGNAGKIGSLKYKVVDPAQPSKFEIGVRKYAPKIVSCEAVGKWDDGVFEPGEEIILKNFVIENEGDLTLPEASILKIDERNSFGIVPILVGDKREGLVLPAIPPKQRVTIDEQTLRAVINPFETFKQKESKSKKIDKDNAENFKKFVSTAVISLQIKLMGRTCSESVFKQNHGIRYPIHIRRITSPNVVTTNDNATFFKVEIENISRATYGSQAKKQTQVENYPLDNATPIKIRIVFGNSLHPDLSKRKTIETNIITLTQSVMSLSTGKIIEFQQKKNENSDAGVLHVIESEITTISPQNTTVITIPIRLLDKVPFYKRMEWRAELYFRGIMTEISSRTVRSVPSFIGNMEEGKKYDILLISHQNFENSEFRCYETLFKALDLRPCYLDSELYSGIKANPISDPTSTTTPVSGPKFGAENASKTFKKNENLQELDDDAEENQNRKEQEDENSDTVNVPNPAGISISTSSSSIVASSSPKGFEQQQVLDKSLLYPFIGKPIIFPLSHQNDMVKADYLVNHIYGPSKNDLEALIKQKEAQKKEKGRLFLDDDEESGTDSETESDSFETINSEDIETEEEIKENSPDKIKKQKQRVNLTVPGAESPKKKSSKKSAKKEPKSAIDSILKDYLALKSAQIDDPGRKFKGEDKFESGIVFVGVANSPNYLELLKNELYNEANDCITLTKSEFGENYYSNEPTREDMKKFCEKLEKAKSDENPSCFFKCFCTKFDPQKIEESGWWGSMKGKLQKFYSYGTGIMKKLPISKVHRVIFATFGDETKPFSPIFLSDELRILKENLERTKKVKKPTKKKSKKAKKEEDNEENENLNEKEGENEKIEHEQVKDEENDDVNQILSSYLNNSGNQSIIYSNTKFFEMFISIIASLSIKKKLELLKLDTIAANWSFVLNEKPTNNTESTPNDSDDDEDNFETHTKQGNLCVSFNQILETVLYHELKTEFFLPDQSSTRLDIFEKFIIENFSKSSKNPSKFAKNWKYETIFSIWFIIKRLYDHTYYKSIYNRLMLDSVLSTKRQRVKMVQTKISEIFFTNPADDSAPDLTAAKETGARPVSSSEKYLENRLLATRIRRVEKSLKTLMEEVSKSVKDKERLKMKTLMKASFFPFSSFT